MAAILIATGSGCRVFTDAGEGKVELAGRQVSALATATDGACLAAVDGQEIWRRDAGGAWSKVTMTGIRLQSITSFGDTIYAGGMNEAAMLRIPASGEGKRLKGFDNTPGRSEWFGNGPPLGVRSLTVTADGAAILAAVHVGGIPRSTDRGEIWTPTVPVIFDVHEVCAHPSSPNIVAAAAAVGLCVSHDGGQKWKVLSEGLEMTTSLAVVVLEEEALFSIQNGPFAKRSQVWRWRIGGEHVEHVRDGLPECLDGKIDTAHIAAGCGCAAVVDGEGNLWRSTVGSTGWERVATDVYAFGLLIL